MPKTCFPYGEIYHFQDCTNIIKDIGTEIPKELNAFFVELKRL